MRPRRRARGPPGLTQEGNFDRAQRRKLAAENRAAKHANRENSQPARTNQAPADDANREDGQPARTNQAAADHFSSRLLQDITNTAGGSSRQMNLT
ncbi:MAG: hypothetical protein FRX49_00170 [Trebouxia sp. A1-2]|nr:MAG: hypothetical protein FRX49_00170 [Trebouxia sp. A1-2]